MELAFVDQLEQQHIQGLLSCYFWRYQNGRISQRALIDSRQRTNSQVVVGNVT